MRLDNIVLDTDLLFDALDKKRRTLKLKRGQVAKILGIHPATWTWWANGGRPTADSLLRACLWLDQDPREFVTTAEAQALMREHRRAQAGAPST